jgi:hypothetical protein
MGPDLIYERPYMYNFVTHERLAELKTESCEWMLGLRDFGGLWDNSFYIIGHLIGGTDFHFEVTGPRSFEGSIRSRKPILPISMQALRDLTGRADFLWHPRKWTCSSA